MSHRVLGLVGNFGPRGWVRLSQRAVFNRASRIDSKRYLNLRLPPPRFGALRVTPRVSQSISLKASHVVAIVAPAAMTSIFYHTVLAKEIIHLKDRSQWPSVASRREALTPNLTKENLAQKGARRLS